MLLAAAGGATALVIAFTGSLLAAAMAGLLVLAAALVVIRSWTRDEDEPEPSRRRFLLVALGGLGLAFVVVLRLDEPRRPDDDGKALPVHPDDGVARSRVVRQEAGRLLRVVRGRVRRDEQLKIAGPLGVIRADDELQVLGAEVCSVGFKAGAWVGS